MKRTEKIREALIQSKIMLQNEQIEAMAPRCPDFDLEEAVNDLILRQPSGASAILTVLQKHRITIAKEFCGKCQSGWVKVLDRRQWDALERREYANMVQMISVKASAPCPNCQPNRKPNLQQIINSSDPDQQAFTWLLLYDMMVFNLEQTIDPAYFDTEALWKVYLRPALPLWISRLKDDIWRSAQKRESIPQDEAVHAVRAILGGV